jgi:predicted amidohydrolase
MKQASMDGPELLVAEIDLGDVGKARRSLPWWRDRRADLYGNLDPT